MSRLSSFLALVILDFNSIEPNRVRLKLEYGASSASLRKGSTANVGPFHFLERVNLLLDVTRDSADRSFRSCEANISGLWMVWTNFDVTCF